MKEIGGYFELELNRGKELHHEALHLNLGRTAFEYVLKARNIEKIYLPYYFCDVMLEPAIRAGVRVEYYRLNEKLEPVFDFDGLEKSAYFLYPNYFGIKDKFIKRLAVSVPNLIIDNCQSFFSKPVAGIDTIYSPRKFFGVPDGGYLYTNTFLQEEFETDHSEGRFAHLIGRIDEGAEKSYVFFTSNEKALSLQPIKRMSRITQRLLQNIDYSAVAEKRRKNFDILAKGLSGINILSVDLESEMVPMVYPFLSEKTGLHRELAGEKIFAATYWASVLNNVSRDSIESMLVKQLVPLPIDQRYGNREMEFIVKCVLEYV
jgi:hypothetical protein